MPRHISPVLLSAKQIAHELNCSTSTIYRLARKGLLPVKKGCSGGRTSRFEIDRKAIDDIKNRRGS